MARLRYSTEARGDFARIQGYIHEQSGSAKAAKGFIGRLRARCTKLASLPQIMGRNRQELEEGLRSVPEGSYIIFFRYLGDTLEVVNIIEGHREMDNMFAPDDNPSED